MTTITIDRATVEQALEALEWHLARGAYGADIEGVTGNLRAALAQQDEPVQEPVYKVKVTSRWHDTEPLAPAFSLPDGEHLLYTAPPQRKPLTEEEIDGLVIQHAGYGRDNFYAVVRAVERAHGIEEQS